MRSLSPDFAKGVGGFARQDRTRYSLRLNGLCEETPCGGIARYLGLAELQTDKVVQWMHDINEGAVRNLANLPQLNEPAATVSAEVKPKIREILERTRLALAGKVPDEPTVLERYLMMQAVKTTYTADEDIVSSLLFMMSACVDLIATAITNVVVELMQRPEAMKEAIAAAQKDTSAAVPGSSNCRFAGIDSRGKQRCND